MYAIIQSGSRQFKVELGSELLVDKIDDKEGGVVTFTPILVADGAGSVDTSGKTQVKATVLRAEKGPKVVSFKYRPKKHSKTMRGQRAHLTRIRVEAIGNDVYVQAAPKAPKSTKPKSGQVKAKTAVDAPASKTTATKPGTAKAGTKAASVAPAAKGAKAASGVPAGAATTKAKPKTKTATTTTSKQKPATKSPEASAAKAPVKKPSASKASKAPSARPAEPKAKKPAPKDKPGKG